MTARSRVVSVSLEQGLLERFDAWLAGRGLRSRSRGFQQLLGEKLDALALEDGRGLAVATVTYVYDHHARELMERLAHLQHEHLQAVVASTHVHLDHARCLEVLILRGPARTLRRLGERILATRGVERGEITITSARPAPGDPHEHAHGGPAWHAVAHDHDHDHGHDHGHEPAHDHPPGAAPKVRRGQARGRAARRKRKS